MKKYNLQKSIYQLINVIVVLFTITPVFSQQSQNEIVNFNANWEFVKDVDTILTAKHFERCKSVELPWENVSLPHTANIEPLVITGNQWQGYCFYRKFFKIPKKFAGKSIVIQFDGAMQIAEVFLNGKHISTHSGGYLPFAVDITDKVNLDKENCILVRSTNIESPLVPPGRPLADLDFCYYSGIYRNAYLIVKDKLHISNQILTRKVAGGGIYVYYSNVSSVSAIVNVNVDVQNDDLNACKTNVICALTDSLGKLVAVSESELLPIEPNMNRTISKNLKIEMPILWSPENPYLYNLTIKVIRENKETDSENIKIGIHTFSFSSANGFELNGSKLKIRGTNRHQEYPYIGNALSDNAQYRDAYKIKLAGFNFVRCSHYPQSPAFLDACDELGILVMEPTPGWQFFGNDEFQKNSIMDIRNMVRRDRNHPSIILWEASLNETEMEQQFIEKAHQAIKEELPFGENYTAGWVDTVYDVFIPARQHATPPDYWNKDKKARPFLIAEYGDWEYYADNAGFNQKEFANLTSEERTSRQLRGNGQKRLAQQALNYQESHNDNLKGNAVGDANWLMFDYNRGYANDLESSGIMDIFRLPKFAFYFYQSQSNLQLNENSKFHKPMIFIANYWNDSSSTQVKVYSNCDGVELKCNGQLIARQKPDLDVNSTNLAHPPFTFNIATFNNGTLTATGYFQEKKTIETSIKTEGKPSGIILNWDESGKPLKAGCNDIVFVYATITDLEGNPIHDYDGFIDFKVKGDAIIVGSASIKAEAGIATILLKAGSKPGNIEIIANGKKLESKKLKLKAN